MHEHLDPGLLAFLRDPASYPHHPDELRELHTHASLVFLVPPLVYKIKKPVDFGFLDFSTLEKRHHYCLREVELNSRLAPGIYLGVTPITREAGSHAFGGAGPVVEYAVKMVHLETDGFLNTRIKAGTAGEPELERVALALADFYQKQNSPPDIATWGTIAKLRISTDENFAQTEAYIGKTISREAFGIIRSFTEACYRERTTLFENRVAGGWIRDCHGDLHLDHIHVTDDTLHIYDCIEFNDRFRHLDIASDAAFLAMDLDYHGRPDLARVLIRRLAELLGDPEMEALMDFYKCYRAYVRGKVESLHSMAELGDAAEREAAVANARRYFQLALQYAVAGSRPLAIVIMGRVATGKSTLATALARELGWPLISSDPLRKALAGIPQHRRGDAASRTKLYSAAMTERTYQTMIDEAAETLRQGHGLILDATFSKRAYRDRLRETIGDANLKWIITEAGEATTRERLKQRESKRKVVSDARNEDHDVLNKAFEPPDELPADHKHHIPTDGAVDHIIRHLCAALACEPCRNHHKNPPTDPACGRTRDPLLARLVGIRSEVLGRAPEF